MVGNPAAVRPGALDRAMGVPPPPRLWIVRGVCGLLLVIGGIAFLSYSAYGLAAAFLVVGTLNIVGFFWYLSMARSQPSRS